KASQPWLGVIAATYFLQGSRINFLSPYAPLPVLVARHLNSELAEPH
ncbi:hypothetical protein TGAM01_v205709, partial [Trichoderma gamsii]